MLCGINGQVLQKINEDTMAIPTMLEPTITQEFMPVIFIKFIKFVKDAISSASMQDNN